MIRVFLDANVLYSAAPGRSPGFRRFWETKGVMPVTSAYAADEAHLSLPESGSARACLLARTELVENAMEQDGNERSWDLPDPKDVPILLSAVRARCDYFVTGDNHFKQMFGRTIDGVVVLRPAAFLKTLGPQQE